jgi:hypothetical protein
LDHAIERVLLAGKDSRIHTAMESMATHETAALLGRHVEAKAANTRVHVFSDDYQDEVSLFVLPVRAKHGCSIMDHEAPAFGSLVNSFRVHGLLGDDDALLILSPVLFDPFSLEALPYSRIKRDLLGPFVDFLSDSPMQRGLDHAFMAGQPLPDEDGVVSYLLGAVARARRVDIPFMDDYKYVPPYEWLNQVEENLKALLKVENKVEVMFPEPFFAGSRVMRSYMLGKFIFNEVHKIAYNHGVDIEDLYAVATVHETGDNLELRIDFSLGGKLLDISRLPLLARNVIDLDYYCKTVSSIIGVDFPGALNLPIPKGRGGFSPASANKSVSS